MQLLCPDISNFCNNSFGYSFKNKLHQYKKSIIFISEDKVEIHSCLNNVIFVDAKLLYYPE
ncbi:MAG TPA: hypothetical protein DCS93_07430 [Microscillaceae bacterium]|nr:hypothetical protein [Microscillaceae bacterium]